MHFNIQHFSTHDGDGIRTILFLKGCSLACPWCQNPESRSEKLSLLFDERLCLADCDQCIKQTSPVERENGNVIFRDAENRIQIQRDKLKQQTIETLRGVCPSQALSVVGEDSDIEQLCQQLLRDKPFYEQSKGGVTFSGGEPLMQAGLVSEIAKRLQSEGVNTAIETCLHVPWKHVEQVLPFIDCWLADLKHTDSEIFKSWAHGSLSRIHKNLIQLGERAKRMIIRVPVVPGFNDSDSQLRNIIDFAAQLDSCEAVHLLPYHTLGINKYNLLDMPYLCADRPLNNPELLERAKAYGESHPIKPMTITIRG